MHDRNKNRPGYKETKVGWIPEEWEFIHLGHAFSKRSEVGTKLLPILSVTMNQGMIERSELDRKMGADLPPEQSLRVCPGDIAYNMMRMWQGSVGLCESEGLVSPAYVICKPKNKTCPKFFYYLFKSHAGLYLLWAYSYGITGDRLRLYFQDFAKVPAALPPLPEQEAIAEVLGCWDEGIETLEKLIDAKKLRKKGLMQRLLSGQSRLPGFGAECRISNAEYRMPTDWKEVRIKDVMKEVKRPVDWDDNDIYSLISVRRRSGGAFLREQLAGAKILTKNMNTTRTGDFLISKMQVCHGATALLPEELDGMHISGSYIALRAKNEHAIDMDFFTRLSATPEFYHLTFLSSYGVHIEKMTFNFAWFMKSKICIPPSLAEQKAIASVLETADEEIRLLEAELAALAEQKKGLMQKLLTGEVRCPAFRKGNTGVARTGKCDEL